MTAQIIYPEKFHPPKITSWARTVVRQAISTKPAYITSNATMNRVIHNLEMAGWTIYPHPDGRIECEFYFGNGSQIFCNLETAQRLQRDWDLGRMQK